METVRRPRCPRWECLVAAVAVFWVSLLALQILFAIANLLVFGIWTQYSPWNKVVIWTSASVAIPVSASYAVARLVYVNARWQRVTYDGNECRNCGYNLTGNVSGACPECGTSINEKQPAKHG